MKGRKRVGSPRRRAQPAMTPGQLYDLRAAAGLTQERLAQLVEVKRLAVTRWENGEVPISAKRKAQLVKVCRAAMRGAA